MVWLWIVGVAVLCFAAGVPAPAQIEAVERATAQRRSGDAQGALETLETAARAFPKAALVHFNLGSVLGELGRHQEAVDAFRASLEIEPENAAAHLSVSKALIGLHSYTEALRQVDHYAGLVGADQQEFDAWHVRGVALRRLGRLEEAEAALRR
ncbi:MAG: tetratricopeptide repeat protein, partial [bacterium]|nr:tetratricopeptide repeat protein [bacterium]